MLLGALLISAQLLAQTRTISGKVSDNSGQGLPFVNVTVVNSTLAAATDGNGNYTISVPANAKSLSFTSVGYATQTVDIPTSGTLNITLVQSNSTLNEVVVTGFSRQKKSEYAGASTKVTAEQVNHVPVASFEQILQGKAPGLTVLSGGGQPGTAAAVTLRGPTSILGGSTPLYVVDGIPVEASVFQSINPNDIESVDVLKDASASALYGSRGAAGVIVVTTKRGQSGKIRVNYSGQAGVTTRPDFNYQMMNTEQLLQSQEAYGLVFLNSNPTATTGLSNFNTLGNIPGWQFARTNPWKLVGGARTAKTAADFADGDRILDSLRKINTDWDDVFFRNGSFNSHDISISGGQGKTRMFSSFGYYKEQGIINRSDLERYTLRNNLDYGGDRFTASISTLVGYNKRNFQESTTSNSTSNPFLTARITPSYLTVLKPDGSGNNASGLPYSGPNLVDAMNFNQNYSNQGKAVLGINANYQITKDITAGILTGLDFRETQSTIYGDARRFNARTSTSATTKSGSLLEELSRFLQLQGRVSLGYGKVFNEKHDVNLTAYGDFTKYYSKVFTSTGFGIDPRTPATPAAITQGNASNLLFSTITGGKSQRAISAGILIGKYTFDRKYTINASFRYDGASSLPEDNRFKGFYSVGVIWDAKAEEFLRNAGNTNTLRVRASYGTSANADNFVFGDFGYLATYAANVSYNGNPGIQVTNPGNPDAQWEYTKQLNIGLDYAFFRSRLFGSVEAYNRITDNLFAQQTLSATSGFGLLNVNAGSVRNRGIEYTVNFDVIRKNNLTWTLTALGAYNENRITSLGQVSSFEGGTGLYEVGKPIGTHYEVGWAGVDAATGKPLFYDLNGKVVDAYLSGNRVTNWGTYFAPWNGSFSTSVRFKGFDFSALLSYQKGSTRVNNLEFFVENPDFLGQGFNQALSLNFWQKPGDQARSQSPVYGNTFNSKLIQSADFMRLRELTLSYTLPRSVASRLKLSNVRIYVLGRNLLTWTKWKGYDPEDNNNISLSEYPNPRTLTGGIEIGF
jgi:TonB-linked SusC/RagA family outer membrane protein